MDFKDASEFVIPFGKYKGKTIDSIAESDDGLKYLDWLYGERSISNPHCETTLALATYLADPTVATDLANLL